MGQECTAISLAHGIMGRRFPDGGLLRYRKLVPKQLGDVADMQLQCFQTRGWLSFGKSVTNHYKDLLLSLPFVG